jgi:hypothetical protein
MTALSKLVFGHVQIGELCHTDAFAVHEEGVRFAGACCTTTEARACDPSIGKRLLPVVAI